MWLLDFVLSFGAPMGLGVALIAMGYGLVALGRGEEKTPLEKARDAGRLQEHAQEVEDKRLFHVKVLEGLEKRALPAHPYRESEAEPIGWPDRARALEEWLLRLDARVCVIETESQHQPTECVPAGSAHAYQEPRLRGFSDDIALDKKREWIAFCPRCGGTVKW